MEFRKVTLDNLKELIALEVAEAQRGLVADNLYTVAQVSLVPDSFCRGVYVDDEPVGFFAVQWEEGHYYIWRFMVAAAQQGKGIGNRMMAKLLAELFADSSIELVDLSVQRREGGAEPFYLKCGFTATEEEQHGEWRMMMARSTYVARVGEE